MLRECYAGALNGKTSNPNKENINHQAIPACLGHGSPRPPPMNPRGCSRISATWTFPCGDHHTPPDILTQLIKNTRLPLTL